MTKDEYADFLLSPYWRELVRRLRKIRGEKCERCGFPYELNLHHLTYERLGAELDSDLIFLCRACHSRAHFIHDLETDPHGILTALCSPVAEIKKTIEQQQARLRDLNHRRADEVAYWKQRSEEEDY